MKGTRQVTFSHRRQQVYETTYQRKVGTTAFKRYMDWYMGTKVLDGYGSNANGTNSGRHLGQQGRVGSKVLFRCCLDL